MTEPTLYRILDEFPYLDREDEYPNLALAETAARMEDLTGVGADVILADFDEDCGRCGGGGKLATGCMTPDVPCDTCHGTGKRSEPWEWTDDETGREVTMRLEVG